jgi:hypothetical protein
MLIYNKLTHPILAQFMQACKIFIDVLREDTDVSFILRLRKYSIICMKKYKLLDSVVVTKNFGDRNTLRQRYCRHALMLTGAHMTLGLFEWSRCAPQMSFRPPRQKTAQNMTNRELY